MARIRKEKEDEGSVFVAGYSLEMTARILVDALLYHDQLLAAPSSSLEQQVNLDEEGVTPFRPIRFSAFLKYLRWEAKLRVENKLR